MTTGGVAERIKALVSKTRGLQGSVGSNPTSSANLIWEIVMTLRIPLATLKINHALFIPASNIPNKAQLRSKIYSAGKAHNMKFVTRMLTEDGILGMRVRRTPVDAADFDVDFGFEVSEISEVSVSEEDELTPLPSFGLFQVSDWRPSYCFECKSWGPDLRSAESWDHALLLCLQHIEKCKGIGSMITLEEVYLVADPMIRLYPDNTNLKDHFRDTLSRFHTIVGWITKQDEDGKYWLSDKGRNYKGKNAGA